MTKYPPEYTKLQHLKKQLSCSMLALAVSFHGGLEVKGSNPLLAFRQSKLVWDLVRSIVNISKWRIILKLRETVRKGECPENVESRRCALTVDLCQCYE